MRGLNKGLILIFGIVFFISCGKKNTESNELSFNEKIKLRQYKVQGEGLYLMHCGNCHQADGSGLGRLIPPLSKNSTLMNDRNQVMCAIKYGLEGPLVIDVLEYNGKMPGNVELTNLEIAEILTFVGNSWGNSIGIVLSSEVEKGMMTCY
tara:strand:- start:121 stop:570 length:450 start_codon:yes stop_codon:yes gene_type:complete